MIWRSILVLCSLSLILGACGSNGYRQVSQYTIEQFTNNTIIFGGSFSHDETRLLVTSDASGIFNAYSLPVNAGKMEQLTFSDSGHVFALTYFPADDRILFTADQDGNEIDHIYLRKEDGTVRDLTPFQGARASYDDWSYDRKSFLFECNRRDQKFMDIYEMDIDNFEFEMIFQNDSGFETGTLSNDKRYMAFSKTITEHNSNMYLYDRHNSELIFLSPHEGDVTFQPVTFSVDSKSLYYLTDLGSEFSYLKRYDIETRQHNDVLKADWDIMYAYFSRSGKYRVVGINNDARTEIRIFDTETGQDVDLPEFPNVNITSVKISDSENLMRFYVNGPRSPNNIYVYDFGTGRSRKLTESLNPEIDPRDLVDARNVRYPSFDDLEIPALLYIPHQIRPGEKAPAIVMVHGGPGGQARIGYDGLVQFLVNHGYVIIDVNNRGSSGYGKTFYKLDDRRHGQDDLADCVEAKKFLAETGYVDTSRVAILGGSYGGYMALAALAFRPEKFAVGVDLFGISNWVRTLNSTPPWWESFRKALFEELGDPATDEEMLRAKSPLFHADNIVRPLLVIQGANDPRVLQVESDEIVEAVRNNGVPVEYIVFEDEGHGFYKKENRIKGYQAILQFLDKYLKSPEPEEVVAGKE